MPTSPAWDKINPGWSRGVSPIIRRRGGEFLEKLDILDILQKLLPFLVERRPVEFVIGGVIRQQAGHHIAAGDTITLIAILKHDELLPTDVIGGVIVAILNQPGQ